MSYKKKLDDIINIRALAIIIVVFGHSIILYSSDWGLYSTERVAPVLNQIKWIINLVQMPLFFSVSGYLFKYSYEKRKGLYQLIKNKAVRLLVPFICIGMFYMIPIRLLVNYPGYLNISLKQIVINKLFMGNDCGHLWFLPTLFLIFILSEIMLDILSLCIITKKYSGILFFVITYAISNANFLPNAENVFLMKVYENFVWFALGYLMSCFRNPMYELRKSKIVKVFLFVMSMVLLIVCRRYGNFGFIASLFLVFVIYIFIPNETNSLIREIDQDSFGIYLFHSPLIYITFSSIPDVVPIIVVGINLLCWGGVAYLLTECVRKMKLGFLIGENEHKR